MINRLNEGDRNTLGVLGRIFAQAGHAVYLVGGSVRDLAMDRELKDADLAVSADQDRIFRVLHKAKGFEAVYDKSQAKGFGTVGARLGGMELDITPFRSRQGSYANQDPLTEDLSWRDFTVNAVALDLDPKNFIEIFDPFKGMKDLKRRALRTPRPPMETLEDDPLRILRAARFTANGFELDPEFDHAVSGAMVWLQDPNRVSVERVRDELFRILAAEGAGRGMDKLHDWGLIGWLLPDFDLEYNWGLRLRMLEAVEGRDSNPMLGLMALLLGAEMEPGARAPSTKAAQRLGDKHRLSRRQARSLAETVRAIPLWLLWNPGSERSDPVGWVVNSVGPSVEYLAALDQAAMDAGLDSQPGLQARQARIRAIRELDPDQLDKYMNPPAPLDGRQVAEALGLELGTGGGGPAIGQAMDFMKQRVVREELDPGDAEAARDLLRRWKEGE